MTDKINAYADFIGKQVKQEEQGISATKIYKSEQIIKEPSADKDQNKINAYANFISKQVNESVITEESDNVTVKDGQHQVTLHRMQSDDSGSTFTVHHPDGTKKKAKISFSKHSDENDEIHHAKVNKAFGLPDNHKIGKKIADGMNGMGGYSKFED